MRIAGYAIVQAWLLRVLMKKKISETQACEANGERKHAS